MRPCLAALAALALAVPAWALDARIAVAEFDNAADTSEFDALGKGLQAMVTTDLAQVTGLTLVERERLSAVTAELDLAGSGLVDPKTAARVGKLLGATHFVAGTFTVVGESMRLDARLVSVESGEVVTAADASGEKDAFFELEKRLVSDLLAGLGAAPSAKERAAIARIHTADFDAFEQFGEGVALYDAQRYDEALATLREVLVKDAEFVLAKRTLEEYEVLIEQIRAKARAIELTEAEQEFVAAQAEAARQAKAVTWLQAKAKDTSAPWEDRVTALYLLTVQLRPFGFSSGGFSELQDVEDQYALFLAADGAYARLYAEMRPRWPAYTPFLVTQEGSRFDPASDDLAAELADVRASLLGDRQSTDMASCEGIEDLLEDGAADMLLLDVRERAGELDRLSTEGKECIGERDWTDARYDVAALYASVLDLDRSTAILESLAASTTDTSLLSRIEHAVGENKELAKIVADSNKPSYREALLLEQKGREFNSYFSSHWLDDAKAANPQALWELTRARGIGDTVFPDPIWLGSTLAHVLPRPQAFATGPRPNDPWRTTSLRYYGDGLSHEETVFYIGGGTATRVVEPEPPEPAWVLLGAGARQDFALGVSLSSAVPDDWWPEQRPPQDDDHEPRLVSEGRPLWGVVFGLDDVDVDAVCDPDGTGMTSVPMHGYGVLFDGDTVKLAKIREVDPDWSEERCSLFTDFVDAWTSEDVATATVKGAAAARKVGVKVKGSAVEVRIDGTTRAFTLPAPANGFTGLLVHGIGFLELSEVTLE